jgi:hypothetical protein
MNRTWVFALAAFASPMMMCDPGWSYSVVGGMSMDGGGFEVPVSSPSVRIRGSAMVFAGSMSIEYELENLSSEDLIIDTNLTKLRDSQEQVLSPASQQVRDCLFEQGRAVVRAASTCRFFLGINVTNPTHVHPYERLRLQVYGVEKGAAKEFASIIFVKNNSGMLGCSMGLHGSSY